MHTTLCAWKTIALVVVTGKNSIASQDWLNDSFSICKREFECSIKEIEQHDQLRPFVRHVLYLLGH